jgi:hypothetical protein
MVGRAKRAPSAWLLLSLLSLGCATTHSMPPPVSELKVRLLDGQVVSWPSLWAPDGTTVVVFATVWCEICRHERPEVEAWARAHREPKRTVYVFSGVSCQG